MLDSEFVAREIDRLNKRMNGTGVSVLMKLTLYVGMRILDAQVMILRKLEKLEEIENGRV